MSWTVIRYGNTGSKEDTYCRLNTHEFRKCGKLKIRCNVISCTLFFSTFVCRLFDLNNTKFECIFSTVEHAEVAALLFAI